MKAPVSQLARRNLKSGGRGPEPSRGLLNVASGLNLGPGGQAQAQLLESAPATTPTPAPAPEQLANALLQLSRALPEQEEMLQKRLK